MYKQRKLRRPAVVLTLALVVAMTLVCVSPGFAQAKGWGGMKDIEKFLKKTQKNLAKQNNLYFYDLQDALWAIASIARMKGFGIINGYDGNVFKPNNPVTQAEALAMIVRALDMEEEAQEIARRFSGTYDAFGFELDDSRYRVDWDRFTDRDELEEYLEDLARYLQSWSKKVNNQYLPFVPSSSRWALGYILLAVEEGWVKISEVNPNAPASRAWISMIMVRALGYEDEALAQMNVKLPYKDANAIPKGMVGYVAVAVELGLFQGYPGGKFQPNKAVTRAEMATIIDRFLTAELPEETDCRVRGTVTDIRRNKITVKAASGRSTTFTISSDALILINNKPSDWDDLSVGDTVEVLSNGQGVALLITLLDDVSGPKTKTLSGEIVLIASDRRLFIEDSDEDIQLIRLASNCKITYGSTTLDFEELRVGDKVQATIGANDLVTALKVTERAQITVSGTILSIPGSRRLNIEDASGKTQTIRLASNCKITYGSSTLDFEDLRVGDKVQATIGANDLVTALKVTERAQITVSGTILSIPGSRRLNIEDASGKTQTIRLASNCKITYGSSTLDFEDLRVGDKVQATIGANDLVTALKVTERAQPTVTGKIVSIPGIRRITVKDANGEIQMVRLASDCKITWGSRTLVFDDLRVGDEVVATLGDNDMATAVKVVTRGERTEALTGVIKSITKTRSGVTVAVTKSDGKDVTLALAGDVFISYGTEALDPEDLRIGDEVKATVAGNKLVEIIIKNRGQSTEFGDLGGVILSISQSSQDFIITLDDDGDITSFSVPRGCVITYGGSTLRRSDLRLGDEIRVDLNTDNEAVEIRVLVRGE
ncbi:MAG: S-layer homology domain-containing protein [Bacillota bacterium]